MAFSGKLLQEAISTFTETMIEAIVLDLKDRKKAEKLLSKGGLDHVFTGAYLFAVYQRQIVQD